MIDAHALELLEFPRVIADVAARAECDGARAALVEARPIEEPNARALESVRLAESIRRTAEPGSWLGVGTGEVAPWLDDEVRGLGVEGLLEIATWLEAGTSTRAAWNDEESAARHPELHAIAAALPDLDSLATTLRASIEPDGRVSDAASGIL